MTDTFTWQVNADASGDGEFLVSQSKFGDGYSQSVPLGINNEQQKWTVVYSGYKDAVMEVLNFIRSHKGGTGFYWTPPLGVQGVYKCVKYKPSNVGGLFYTLTMEFEQSYAP